MNQLFFSLCICLLLWSTGINAQGHNIKVSVSQMPNKNLILAHYSDGKIYVNDTIKLDAQGNGVFKDSKKLWKGLYVLVFSNSNIFDFIVGDNQNFTIITDTLNAIENSRFEGSAENIAYYDFQKFLMQKNKQRQSIEDEFGKDPKKDDPEIKKTYWARFEEVNRELHSYIANLTKQFPGSATASFTNLTLSPIIPDFSKEIPEGTKNRDGEIGNRSYFYKKNHYWDNIDFRDSSLLCTPIFKSKLDDYFNNMLIMVPDTVYKACTQIIEKAHSSKVMYRYLTEYCLNFTFESKIMGMDEAFVKVGQKYFVGKKADWVDAKRMKTIEEEVYKRQYNLIGEQAIDLKLPSIDGNWVSLYETKAPLTFLVFWEPNCGHCKKQLPLVKTQILDQFKQYGLKVFAVQTQTNKEEWEKLVQEDDLFDFINCWDPKRQSNYWTIYNVFSTPVMYLLDKDKKIIAKQLDVEQFVDMIKHEFKKQGIEIK